MSFRISVVALAAVVTLGFSSAARAETLADALTAAYTNSGLLDQNRALLRAADEDVAQAVALTLPVISWSVNATSSYSGVTDDDTMSTAARISADLTLYDGGSNQLAVEAQKEVVLGTRQGLRKVEQSVLLNAVTAYMQVRSDSEFVTLRQSNVRVLTQEFRAANDRFEVGEVTRTDVALAEARLAAARSLLTAAEGSLARSEEAYIVAVGNRPQSLSPATAAPVSKSLTDAKAFAVRNHPDLLRAQHSVSAAELLIRRAEAAMKPTVSLGAQVGGDWDDSDRPRNNNFSSQIGVTASGPIYAGGRLSSQVRQLMSRRDAERATLLVTSLGIEQQVANAFSFLEVARASAVSSKNQITAARVAFRGVREEATLGARTTLDVLNAEQELLSAQANLIAAQADEVVASYQVLSAMGLLTAAHLRLPVQQYDPAAYYNLVKDAPTNRSSQGQALDRVLKAIGQ